MGGGSVARGSPWFPHLLSVTFFWPLAQVLRKDPQVHLSVSPERATGSGWPAPARAGRGQRPAGVQGRTRPRPSPRFSLSSQVSTESLYGMKSVFFFFLFCRRNVQGQPALTGVQGQAQCGPQSHGCCRGRAWPLPRLPEPQRHPQGWRPRPVPTSLRFIRRPHHIWVTPAAEPRRAETTARETPSSVSEGPIEPTAPSSTPSRGSADD